MVTMASESPAPFCPSWRLTTALGAMLGLMLSYMMRADMSMAIVCMVNQTALDSAKQQKTNDTNSSSSAVLLPSCIRSTSAAGANVEGKFLWDEKIQTNIIGMFFTGYILTQLPAAWIAGRFGAKWVLCISIALAAGCSLITPVAANWGHEWVIALRFVLGMALGAMFPVTHSVIGVWAPPMERSKMASIAYAGPQLGNALTMPIAGLLCASSLGWESIFYIFGGLGLLWCVLWGVLASNFPTDHRFISEKEKDYITNSLENKSESKFVVPWLRMIMSPPVWGLIFANFCSDWGAYTFMSLLPKYMNEVLLFDLASNGFISALPYLMYWFVISVAGPCADFIRSRELLSTVNTRRFFTLTGFLIPAGLLIIMSFLDCSNPTAAVALVIMVIGLSGLQYSGWIVSIVDIAPRFAGIILGISNTIAALSGYATNYIAGVILESEERTKVESYRIIFFITAGVMIFGATIYTILIRGELQPWAYDDSDVIVEVDERKTNGHTVELEPLTKDVDA